MIEALLGLPAALKTLSTRLSDAWSDKLTSLRNDITTARADQLDKIPSCLTARSRSVVLLSGSGLWPVPDGVSSVDVLLIGGGQGGGGGGGNASQLGTSYRGGNGANAGGVAGGQGYASNYFGAGGNGGGGAGGERRLLKGVPVPSGGSVAYQVGSGGIGGAGGGVGTGPDYHGKNGTAGGLGGNTVFGSFTAVGGGQSGVGMSGYELVYAAPPAQSGGSGGVVVGLGATNPLPNTGTGGRGGTGGPQTTGPAVAGTAGTDGGSGFIVVSWVG